MKFTLQNVVISAVTCWDLPQWISYHSSR